MLLVCCKDVWERCVCGVIMFGGVVILGGIIIFGGVNILGGVVLFWCYVFVC
jgi:hypothetical protein